MAAPTKRSWQMRLLLPWHALLGGAFLVAWVSGDLADGLHRFAGTVVLAAVAGRLLLGVAVRALPAAQAGGPLALPRPAPRAIAGWLGGALRGDHAALAGRSPLLPLLAVLLLTGAGLAAASGWLAEVWHAAEDPHEAIATLAGVLALAHVVLAWGLDRLRRRAASGREPLAGRHSGGHGGTPITGPCR